MKNLLFISFFVAIIFFVLGWIINGIATDCGQFACGFILPANCYCSKNIELFRISIYLRNIYFIVGGCSILGFLTIKDFCL